MFSFASQKYFGRNFSDIAQGKALQVKLGNMYVLRPISLLLLAFCPTDINLFCFFENVNRHVQFDVLKNMCVLMEINIVNFLLVLEQKYGFYTKEMKTTLLIHPFSFPCIPTAPLYSLAWAVGCQCTYMCLLSLGCGPAHLENLFMKV